MHRRFHPPQPVAYGSRLSRFVRDSALEKKGRMKRFHPLIRMVSAVLSITLFFSASPALFAMSARQAMSGGGGNAGGAGGAANLQNAGAASASLTSQLAQADLQKTDSAVTAMQAMQARAHAIMAPAGTPNGLKIGWLDAYNPTGTMNSKYPTVPVTWSGVKSLLQSGNSVNISQNKQSAYLYWNHFSVGPQTKVNFDQSAGGNNVGTWIAFNKVMGNVNPSQIYGSITAQGQVYILNQNGILFHNGSQVNTHALVASTLPINDNLTGDPLTGITGRGIANNPDYQFLFSAVAIAAGTVGPTAAFTPPAAPSAGIGNVVVEQGATITAPANASHTGGLVALIGPDVFNAGSISTPDGQTILAAGLQVGLNPHPSSDPSLRGMDVYVGEVSGSSVTTLSSVTGISQNSGYLFNPEGDVTMIGKTVQQNGVIDSSTSVSLNGRIDLLANYNAVINDSYKSQGGAPILYKNTGLVEIGAGSVMRILPEWGSDATVTGTALALNSIISIVGSSVQMGSGAIIEAPGAVATSGALSEIGVSLESGVTIQAGNWFPSGLNASQFVYTGGQITLGSGAEISVAGSTDISVDSAQNFLTLQLRGAELANSTLERTSSLRGVTLTLDERLTGTYNGQYWIGTPLGDATGFANLIERTVGQLTTAGGSVSLAAGSSVVMAQGSSIDSSGGYVNYTGGDFATTKLIYQGHLVDISQATPDKVYSGIYSGGTTETDAKWGITKTYTSILDPDQKHYEAPYISGADGGSITIQAPLQILNGTLMGNTVTGSRQLRESASLSTLPGNSALTLDLFGQTLLNNVIYTTAAQQAPSVIFSDTGVSSASSLMLSPDLVSADGFGNLQVLNHDGIIALPSDTSLNAGVNGSITLEAANITIDGSIAAPGGTVTLTADLAPYSIINGVSILGDNRTALLYDILVNKSTGDVVAQMGASSGGKTTVINADGTISSVSSALLKHYDAGVVTVGSEATISTAGLLVNDTLKSSSRDLTPVALNGGSITISGYQVNLQKGGILNVSGGALLPVSGSITYGNAGSISIAAGQASLSASSALVDIHNGSLQLGSTLEGYAGSGVTAGTLAITAPAIEIGGISPVVNALILTPDFFSQGGFGTFNLTGVGREIFGSTAFIPGVELAAGTIIHPEVLSSIVMPSDQGFELNPFTPDASYRTAANISLTATGLKDTIGSVLDYVIRGDVVIGENSAIVLDPQIKVSGSSASAVTGSVLLKGDTVAVMGSITVPGGSITVSGDKAYPSNDASPTVPLLTVDLSPLARLSTAGEALFVHDPLGMRQYFGGVLSGGSISISGNILAETGSVLDVSGANGIYDLFPYQLGEVSGITSQALLSPTVIAYQVDSSGGSITLNGGQELYSEAALVAQSGGPTAAGGTLSISSGRFYQNGQISEPTDFNLAVQQEGGVLPTFFSASGQTAIGRAISSSGGIAEGGGHIAIDSFAKGGFDSVTLGGNVIFNGPVTLSVPGSIKVATSGAISADALVNLSADYISLGTPFITPLAPNSVALTTAFGTSTDPGYLPPTYGTGSLHVTAQLIDLGNLSLQNIGSANLVADGGAIRGDGTFDIAGNLLLRAAQIYPVSGVNFTLAAYNHDETTGKAISSGGVAGSIMVQRSGSLNLPLSAEGNLSLYASSIVQGGVLEAPFGTINIGNDGGGSLPHDPVSGLAVPTAKNLVLADGSITSVSGVDPFTGLAISVPYGTSTDGTSWIDPSGTTITTTGLSGKAVNLSAQSLTTAKGSLIDLQGGGNITASEWISGLGGTLNLLGTASEWSPGTSYTAGALVTYKGNTWSARQANSDSTLSVGQDWTEIPTYYAVIPGYQSTYAPTGYADGSLGVGSRVTLSGGAGLPSGTYTLLPASYATQPGAYLISAYSLSDSLAGSFTQADGSVVVSGTRFNGLDAAVTTPSTTTLFQLLSPSAIASRVQYALLYAGSFFSTLGASSQPDNAGKLLFQATSDMALNGSVFGQGASGGNGTSIDISTPLAIDITQNGTDGTAGDLVLGAAQLSSWSFGSLLLGGERGTTASGLTPVTVTSSSITMEAGATLVGNDIILAANNAVTLNQGSSILALGNAGTSDENLSVRGDGALLRVSSDQQASDTRSGSDSSVIGGVTLGAGVELSGASITLDSSGNASISPEAILHGQAINLSAGKIALNFDGTTESGALNLSGSALQSLSKATALNLTSYSSLDFHGDGVLGSASLASLGLHAGEILGDNGSLDSILASSILLDNDKSSADPSGESPIATGGNLTISGSLLTLGSGALSVGGFQDVTALETGGIQGKGKGSLITAGNLTFNTPVLAGAASANTKIIAGGTLQTTASGTAAVTPGLGASLTLQGASVSLAAPVILPSGTLAVTATGGDVTISSLLSVTGTSKNFFNVTKYTSAGNILLSSDSGNINLAADSSLNLDAPSIAGSAGSLSISTPLGTAIFGGTISAKAAHGTTGSFVMDVKGYGGGDLTALESQLAGAGFTQSQGLRVRTGDVTVGDVKAHSYTLSADAGSITVDGIIDASGTTGGNIALQANGNVTVASGSELTVHADTYDSSGKGGSIFLSAGAEINGVVNTTAAIDLAPGSIIDLGVTSAATSIQDLGGVLHLRAPEGALGNITLASSISGASSIEVEGYKLYSVSGSAGNITPTLQNQILSDIQTFYGASGGNSVGATAILASLNVNLTSANQAILNLAPGVEIINLGGAITLPQVLNGAGVSQDDWNLAPFRVGANSAPGFLTLRASGNITLNASLSDGFQNSSYNANLLSQNTALPVDFQSWSYQLTAGSDLSAASLEAVLSGSSANVSLGVAYRGGGQNIAPTIGVNASTAKAISGAGYNYYQVIRTGTGDISIAASGDLQLWNQFASIYTAGVQVTDPTLGGTFDVPVPDFSNQSSTLNTTLGIAQQSPAYSPQYSYAGGNIAVNVGGSITQLTKDNSGNVIADSDSELPSNWLYRRGALAADGTFLHTTIPVNEVESTTWWVDFSNFFDDFGALGGGNITLNAGANISNINASIPTNYRMPGHTVGSTTAIVPNAANGVELGGGDLVVNSGNNIDAGVYYVENGKGSLKAGGSIVTNATRDPNHPASLRATTDSSQSYLPTTLFLGEGSFDVQANGSILLGPVANVFLTPQGVNNSYWYKDYFSTYASTDAVNVTSLGGSITFRETATASISTGAIEPLLELWMQGFTTPANGNYISDSQPWLRLAEASFQSADGLSTLFAIAPPTLNATALSGSITLQGNLTTMPSATGNITLFAAENINGLADAGAYNGGEVWISSQINLSNADPSDIPGIADPISQRSITPSTTTSKTALINFMGHKVNFASVLIPFFAESGSYASSGSDATYGVLQTKEALNGTSLLHAGDTTPLQFYAQSGNISGLTLYSAKQAEISAGGDITDIGLYIQNNSAGDVSLVSAGGDIIAYDPTSPLQQLAQAALSGTLQSGDIQVSGPGTLEVLAGGNIDLGNNPGNAADSTLSLGITSIGNNRNPNLPSSGADLIVEAGVKLPTGLSSTGVLALEQFVNTILSGVDGATYLSELADTMTYSGDPLPGTITAASFDSGSTQLSAEEKAKLELQLFYIVLRDTGRNHNKAGSSGFGNYATGEAAIKTFFGNSDAKGDVITWSEEIATLNGGNINVFAPGGGVTLASTASQGNQTPPGIITEGGGGINIYTRDDVSIGNGRIFTLRGGDIMIWSNFGNIAAGSSSKTVQTAPPTQVLIDPTSGNVETDLAGLATGGGIGVLETVAGVPPGNVDLIAPSGVIDAGDAGIRSSGNLNLAATKILNADNIAASGTTAGAPPAAPAPAAPNISGASAAASAGAANNSAAQTAANNSSAETTEPAASIISVEVLGYGGGDGSDDDSSSDQNPPTSSAAPTPAPQAAL